jgi:hypothetical protein
LKLSLGSPLQNFFNGVPSTDEVGVARIDVGNFEFDETEWLREGKGGWREVAEGGKAKGRGRGEKREKGWHTWRSYLDKESCIS